MTTKTYLGRTHIFESKEDNLYTEIKAGSGEQLYIKELRNQKIEYSDNSDDLGFNQLSNETDYQNTDTTNLKNQGTSVSITRNNGGTSYFCVGCPVPGGALGGCFIGSAASTTSTFTLSTPLLQTSATTNALNGLYSDINEEGNLIVFTDKAANSSTIQTYRRSGATWATSNIINGGGIACKVSTKNNIDYCLASTYSDVVEVYTSTGGAWSLQQTLNSGSGSDFFANLQIFDGNTVAFSDDTQIKIYTRQNTTWTLIQTIALASVTSLDLNGLFLVATTTNTIHFYRRNGPGPAQLFSLINSLTFANVIAATVNLNGYVFATGTGKIGIFYQYGNEFIKSTNDTIITYAPTKCSASNKYLIVGSPSSDSNNGYVYVYEISNYENSLITTNEIDLSGNDLTITSNYGNVVISPAIEITNGYFADGSTAAPSISFESDKDTGVYRIGTNIIGVACNGADAMKIKENQVEFKNGTAADPAITNINDLNTGIYFPAADSLSISVGGSSVGTFGANYFTTTAISCTNAFSMVHTVDVTVNQTILTATQTKLTATYWDSSLIHQGHEYPTFSDGTFTITKAGTYLISYSYGIGGGSTTAGVRSFYLSVDDGGLGSPLIYAYNNIRNADPGGTDRTSCSGSCVVPLSLNSTIECYIFQNSGSSIATNKQIRGSFMVYRLC